jgi:hypothetical protein
MEKTALNVQKRANIASAKMEKRRKEKAAISESSVYKLMSDKLHSEKEELQTQLESALSCQDFDVPFDPVAERTIRLYTRD